MKKEEASFPTKTTISIFLIGAIVLLAFLSWNAYNNIQSAAVISPETCQWENLNQEIPVAGLRGSHFWLPYNEKYTEARFLGMNGELSCNDCSLTINGQRCFSQKGSVTKEVVDLMSCVNILKEGKNAVEVSSPIKTSVNQISKVYVEMEVRSC